VIAASIAGVSAQARQWPSERPPRALAARPMNFPPYEIKTLANGLKVVYVSHHEQPAVSIRLIVRAGAAMDPKGKLGLAMLTASLLDQGAGGRTAEQIADTIDFNGGILGTGAGTDLTYVNAVVMKDSLELGLQLLSDVVRRPTFAADEIERQRQQALSSLKVAADDPDNVASQVIDRLIYGFHPYGLPGSGTAESLTGLKRQDFVDFHQQFYVPNNAILAIVGDVTAAEATAGVEKAFGDWAPREVPPFKPIDPPPPTRRIVIIDKPDAVQTEIRVGQIGIPRKHADYDALDQAVKILGGEGANRLQQVLRSQRSLTYGASADLDTYKSTGGIVAETDTRTSGTAETLRVIVDEIIRLQRETVYDGELSGAQNYMVGHFPLNVETPDAIATQVLNQLFYELPLEQLQDYRERTLRITSSDIQRVARSYFHPDQLAVVLVGNADAFVKDLKGVGFTDFERIPIDQVDLMAADLRRSAGARRPGQLASGGMKTPGLRIAPAMYQQVAGIDRSPQDAGQVEQLLKKAVDARGGLEALKAVKRIVAEADTTLATPESKVTAKTKTYVEYPSRMRVDAKLPDAQVVQVYADGKGWLQDPSGIHDAPPDMLTEFAASARRDVAMLLLGASAGELEVRMLPEEGFNGRTLKVLGITAKDLQPIALHIDPQSGEVVKIAYESRGAGPKLTEEIFSDYRKVDGISLPFKAAIARGGVVLLERQFTSVEINPTIGPEIFAKPR
jgi:zinc protease